MNLGLDTTWLDLQKWIGRFTVKIHFPNIKIGHFTNLDNEKWVGIKLEFNTDIHFDSYDYGYVISFIILGFGISINKVSV